MTELQNVDQFTAVLTDLFFFYPLSKVLERRVPKVSEPIYFYNFDYRGSYSSTSSAMGNETDYGVAHADELQYIFSPPAIDKPADAKFSKTDLQVQKTMVELWTSFAETGFVDSKILSLQFEVNSMYLKYRSFVL